MEVENAMIGRRAGFIISAILGRIFEDETTTQNLARGQVHFWMMPSGTRLLTKASRIQIMSEIRYFEDKPTF
jgi:hypothetical protein